MSGQEEVDRSQVIIEEGFRANLDNQPLQRTWNVIAPDGFCFEEQRHTQVEFSLRDAKKIAREWDFQRCPPDCECQDEEEG